MKEKLRIIRNCIVYNKRRGVLNLIRAASDLYREPLQVASCPIYIQIEPTLYCNLECKMCVNPLNNRERRHMQLKEFKTILEYIPSVSKISLVGAGEPLLNPDLFDMIDYAKSKGIMIGFATNGTLLNDNVCKGIIESKTDWVNISLDSADKDTYENIRKRASLEALLDNIRSFSAMKADTQIPEISLWFVIMKDNITGLPEVIKLASDLGVKKVSAQLEHNWSNEQIKNRMAGKQAGSLQEALRGVLKKAQAKAKEFGIKFNYVNIPDVSSRRSCKWPWKSCYITVEGFVTPCCLQGANPDVINFGNIFKESFDRIWNGFEYQEFRGRLKSKMPPEICIGCPGYHKRLEL